MIISDDTCTVLAQQASRVCMSLGGTNTGPKSGPSPHFTGLCEVRNYAYIKTTNSPPVYICALYAMYTVHYVTKIAEKRGLEAPRDRLVGFMFGPPCGGRFQTGLIVTEYGDRTGKEGIQNEVLDYAQLQAQSVSFFRISFIVRWASGPGPPVTAICVPVKSTSKSRARSNRSKTSWLVCSIHLVHINKLRVATQINLCWIAGLVGSDVKAK